LQAAWPGHWEQILEANNQHPPMCLRVDVSRCSRADYLAQLAARLLAPRERERLLDACAAPGGKSGALLELAPQLALTALDIDAQRLQLVADNLRRLGRTAQLVAADLCAAPDWWDGAPFDGVLLDVPCSATGVIRRHPDIKLLRRASDIVPLTERQREILVSAWKLLRPGGRLLYVTCSVLPAENLQIIRGFLATQPEAREEDMAEAMSGVPAERLEHGWQLLPGGDGAADGFYYCCLVRGA
jgi:16S rRNA (cytosine967-C5)-methyltransferase